MLQMKQHTMRERLRVETEPCKTMRLAKVMLLLQPSGLPTSPAIQHMLLLRMVMEWLRPKIRKSITENALGELNTVCAFEGGCGRAGLEGIVVDRIGRPPDCRIKILNKPQPQRTHMRQTA